MEKLKQFLPPRARRWLKRKARFHVGVGSFAGLRRLQPLSPHFGLDLGKPVDRYYIESFLARNAKDIRGRVLEVADDRYTRRFGWEVEKSDVLHVEQGQAGVTIVADLAGGEGIPSEAFDCAIITQTLQYIYKPSAAVQTIFRLLKPGGVALVTVPGISQIARGDMDRFGDCWRFTTLSARRLFEEAFPARSVTVASHGNVLTAVAFLHGLALEELTTEELNYNDVDYQLTIAIRAQKPSLER